jgi:hypothetical protein
MPRNDGARVARRCYGLFGSNRFSSPFQQSA